MRRTPQTIDQFAEILVLSQNDAALRPGKAQKSVIAESAQRLGSIDHVVPILAEGADQAAIAAFVREKLHAGCLSTNTISSAAI